MPEVLKRLVEYRERRRQRRRSVSKPVARTRSQLLQRSWDRKRGGARLADLGLNDGELSELTLVYDKGNNSKENQPLADELGLGVVGSLSPYHHPELLDIARDRFTEIEAMPGTLAYRTQKEIYGKERTIYDTLQLEALAPTHV
jgi:hypothetical protein